MKAFRKVAGNIVEIRVDVDLNGEPLLPPNTTVDPRPEYLEGHYSTIEGNSWVVIAHPVQPVEVITFESIQQNKLLELSAYRDWLLEQPVEHDGRMFDADDTARTRISQAIVSYTTLDTLPGGWVDANDELYPIETYEDLVNLARVIADIFQARFFETAMLRVSISAATTEEELNLITFGVVSNDAQ